MKIATITQNLRPHLLHHGITKAGVFGSYAHDLQKDESDLDLLIEAPEDMGLLGFISLQRKLSKALNVSVDLHTYDSLHPLAKEQIIKEEIPIELNTDHNQQTTTTNHA